MVHGEYFDTIEREKFLEEAAEDGVISEEEDAEDTIQIITITGTMEEMTGADREAAITRNREDSGAIEDIGGTIGKDLGLNVEGTRFSEEEEVAMVDITRREAATGETTEATIGEGDSGELVLIISSFLMLCRGGRDFGSTSGVDRYQAPTSAPIRQEWNSEISAGLFAIFYDVLGRYLCL